MRRLAPTPVWVSHPLSTPVTVRFTALVAAIVLVGTLLPATTAHATSHPALPGLVGSVGPNDEIRLEETDVIIVGEDGGRSFGFRGPSGTLLAGLHVWVNDGCDVNGRTHIWGANASGLPVDLASADPAFPLAVDAAVPAGTADEPAGFAFADPFDCGGLMITGAGRFRPLDGTIAFKGRNRACGNFNADVTISESKRGNGPDTLTLRDVQSNSIIGANPLVTLDDANVYDELFFFASGPSDGDDGTVFVLDGVGIGGGQGTVPKRKVLERAIDDLPPQRFAELVDDAIDRAGDRKKVTPLLRALDVARNACTYGMRLRLDADSDPDSVRRLGTATRPPAQQLATDRRFKVEVDWDAATMPEVSAAGLSTRGSSPEPSFRFFASDDWEAMIKIVDGCGFNDHFWVFYATTGVEFDLTVTDTVSGESRDYRSPEAPAAAVTDTSAFATCP